MKLHQVQRPRARRAQAEQWANWATQTLGTGVWLAEPHATWSGLGNCIWTLHLDQTGVTMTFRKAQHATLFSLTAE